MDDEHTPAIGRRRAPLASPPTDDAGEPRLVELLRNEIEAGGRLTFARFMQRALYEPGLGYYATSRERPTRAGDFLTAPELHPIFGRLVVGQVEEMRRRLGEPAGFTVREYGAGRGTLGAALPAHVRYQPIEFADWVPDEPLVGVVLANEFLDALPVHRVLWQDGELRELFVGWRDGRFVELADAPSSPALAEWFESAPVRLAEGQRAEVCLAAGEWLAGVAGQLERGYVLIVDYAAEPDQLYGADRFGGTLRAFRGHHLSGDALAGVGRQDLTATVDLAALRRAAAKVGLDHLGTTSQAEFLVGAGLEAALADERARAGEDWSATLLLRSAVARLLDPRQLGGYRVVVFGRDVASAPALAGLAYRMPATGR